MSAVAEIEIPDVAYSRRANDWDSQPKQLLIDNGKPNARDVMQFVAAELQERFPISRVDIFKKSSAGKPIDPDDAKVIAARSHMVISGIGD